MIRDASPEDAGAIADVFAAAWEHVAATLEPPDKEAFNGCDLRAMWRAAIENPERRVLVFDSDENVVGFVVTSLAAEPATPVHVRSLYVDPSRAGQGIGSALLRAAVAESPAWLTVFEVNTVARSFYTRNGWRVTGPADNEEFASPLLRMERAV